MSFGYGELVYADVCQARKVRASIMSGKVGLLNVLHRVPAHMQERGHVLDGAYAREFDNKAAEPVGVSALARNKMKALLTDGTAILASNTLDFHPEFNLFMPDGNTPDCTYGASGADDMPALTARATKFFRTGLDFQYNTVIFVAYSCAFLLTDAKGVVQKAGIHCYCCLVATI